MSMKDATTKIGSGATPRGGESVYLSTRINCALIRSQNVHDRWFDSSSLAYISEEHAESLKSVAVQSGDLLLNITGDGVTFARSCLAPDEILPARVNQHVAIIRPRPEACRSGYLLSYLTHPAIKIYIEAFNSGGSRRAITKRHIESFLIPLPPISTQEALERILNTFDKKIDLNRRMNQTLEATAGAIFKSWFVDSDSALSQGSGTVANLLVLHRGALDPSMYPDEAFFHYSIPAFDVGKIPAQESGRNIKSTKFVVPPGAVLISKINPRIPRVWRPRLPSNGRAISSTEFHVVTPKQWDFDREYIFSLLNSDGFIETFAARATGTSGSHQRVRAHDLLTIECAMPNPEVRERYSAVVKPMFDRIDGNLEESRTLGTLRDTLLPKLLSGEIRIEQAEKIVEEVA